MRQVGGAPMLAAATLARLIAAAATVAAQQADFAQNEYQLAQQANSQQFDQISNASLNAPQRRQHDERLSDSSRTNYSNNNSNSLIEQQEQQQSSSSFSDWWSDYWSRQPFPSGYTQSSITMLACLMTTIIFLIFVGNLLVCIAIFTEKSLKPTQNWFIASLAVSDMLLGLIVMPFSLARELMGFWVFGPLWCDIHEAVDVLLSTASINTLCLISLDRYWSITQAVSYLKKRTPRRCAFMIAFVWFFSAAVSLPPLFGWKKQSPSVAANGEPSGSQANSTIATATSAQPDDRELPRIDSELQAEHRKRRRRAQQQQQLQQLQRPALTELVVGGAAAAGPQTASPVAYLSFKQQLEQSVQQEQQQAIQEYPTCQLSEDVGYVLYSAFGSFYIPCAVMVFTYIKIFLAARSRARRAINKQAARSQAAGAKRPAGASAQPAGGARRTLAGSLAGGRALTKLGDAAAAATGYAGRQNCQSPRQLEFQQQQPMKAGKLVVVERRKSQTALAAAAAARRASSQHQSTLLAQTTTTGCTLTKSEAKQASPSALKAVQPNGGKLEPLSNGGEANLGPSQAANESTSSMITVMSASMSELPVTRFQFKTDPEAAPGQASDEAERANRKAAALLQAISQASSQTEQLHKAAEEVLAGNPAQQKQQQQQQQKEDGESDEKQEAGANCTNETCFMTIEEDSDSFEAQAGRTLMIIACNAKQASNNLAAKSRQSGIVMTMMPAQIEASSSSQQPLVCNNAGCLRQRRTSAKPLKRARRGGSSSRCGSNMTIDDEDDDDELEDDDDDEDEDEDEETSDGDDDDEQDDEDEDDELLSECNGYSGASCTLDQYDECLNPDSCAMRCHECAALEGDEFDNDGCQLSPVDSPLRRRCTQAKRRASRHNPSGSLEFEFEEAEVEENNNNKNGNRDENEDDGADDDERLSLTAADCRSQDDECSSVIGHDVLDATTNLDHHQQHQKRHCQNSKLFQHHHHHHKRHCNQKADKRQQASCRRASTAPLPSPTHKQAGQQQASCDSAAEEQRHQQGGRKKSSTVFRLSRLGSSVPPLSGQSGGLLALAASQHQQQVGGSGSGGGAGGLSTRNLKALRQNFFHKLNQLTAKSALKQKELQKRSAKASEGKSSAQSSYGSSYEPSVDYATTSNVHSTLDHYNQETTLDDYEPQTSGETTTKELQSGANNGDQAESSQQQQPRTSGQQTGVQTRRTSSTDNFARLQFSSAKRAQEETDSKQQASYSASQNTAQASDEHMPCGPNQKSSLGNEFDQLAQHRQNHHDSRHHFRGQRTSGALMATSPDGTSMQTFQGNKRTSVGGTTNFSSTIVAASALASSDGTGPGRAIGSKQASQTGGPIGHRAYLASDNERHKRKVAKARERRATLILGLIMTAFICSWLPFFTFYVMRALCHVCRDYISPRFEAFIFWMGYCNSAINPIIYTIFNRDFRKAFRKILFKCL